MAKLKLMTVLGTRPEIIRLSAVISCADRYFDHILVHTGQNYDYTLNKIFFDELGLRAPDYYLESVGANLGALFLQFGGHAAMRLREEFVAGGEQVARHRCAHDAEADESEFHVSSP